MSESKTRFGYTGDGEPPDSDEAQAARTIIGHDIHLQLPPGFVPPKTPPLPIIIPPPAVARTPVPPGKVMTAVKDETTDAVPFRRPYRKKSGLARFLGRWTQSGRFESRSNMNTAGEADIELPRESAGRNVLLVLVVAVLTFVITFAIVKLRQRIIADPLDFIEQVPAHKTQPSGSSATLPPAPSAPTAQVPDPSNALPPLAKPAAQLSPTEGQQVPAAKSPVIKEASHPRKPRTSISKPPEHLSGELLPLEK